MPANQKNRRQAPLSDLAAIRSQAPIRGSPARNDSQTMNRPQPPTALDLSATQRLSIMRQAQDALRRNPKNVDALLTIAGIFGAERNFDDAIATLKKALAARKKDADILSRLASACHDAGDLSQARKYARKLTEIAPRVAEYHKKYGLILELQGFPDSAVQAFLKADRLQPGRSQTLHDIGRNYGLMGDHARALEFYRKALDVEPTYGMALFSYASARRITADEVDGYLAAVEKSVPLTSDPAVNANLHYGAAKALDDVGRYDEAFEWMRRANDLRRPDDDESFLAPFINTIEAFPADLFRSRAGAGVESDQPIFILGMPRSGTTLTESLCGAHSKVTAGDERLVMNGLARGLGRESTVTGAYRDAVERMNRADFRKLGAEYLERCRAISGTTPHFTDKLPHNFLNIGLIALALPNARIIHCRRHPMDNCLSLYSNSLQGYHNKYKTDLTRLGMYYRQYLRLMEHWRAVLPGRLHEVFYEDLVANTEWNARAMIGHLGLEWEDGVLDRTGSQRSVRTASGWQVRQPVYQTSSGKWHKYEKHLGALIEAVGKANVDAYERELADISAQTGQAS